MQRIKDDWYSVINKIEKFSTEACVPDSCDNYCTDIVVDARLQQSERVVGLVKLVVYCRSREHRSVAAPEISGKTFDVDGIRCRPTIHLAQKAKAWQKLCGGHCLECSEHNAEKEDALLDAVRNWRSL